LGPDPAVAPPLKPEYMRVLERRIRAKNRGTPEADASTQCLPHSDALHVTERYRLERGGKRLQAVFTVEDARTFSAPWSFKADYVKRRDYELRENVCADKLVAGQ
jgi:hypothetical protein